MGTDVIFVTRKYIQNFVQSQAKLKDNFKKRPNFY